MQERDLNISLLYLFPFSALLSKNMHIRMKGTLTFMAAMSSEFKRSRAATSNLLQREKSRQVLFYVSARKERS